MRPFERSVAASCSGRGQLAAPIANSEHVRRELGRRSVGNRETAASLQLPRRMCGSCANWLWRSIRIGAFVTCARSMWSFAWCRRRSVSGSYRTRCWHVSAGRIESTLLCANNWSNFATLAEHWHLPDGRVDLTHLDRLLSRALSTGRTGQYVDGMHRTALLSPAANEPRLRDCGRGPAYFFALAAEIQNNRGFSDLFDRQKLSLFLSASCWRSRGGWHILVLGR